MIGGNDIIISFMILKDSNFFYLVYVSFHHIIVCYVLSKAKYEYTLNI